MFKSRKIKIVFLIYWFLLVYILAALVWWFIALSQQNNRMSELKLLEIKKDEPGYTEKFAAIEDERKRKTAQYIGEGSIFFLLIIAGAIFVYRAVNSELKISRQQQNFMMAVTHELKTPIAVAKLNLETLKLRKLDEVQQQRLISNTLQETNRLNSLCNNMLISSQIEAGGYRLAREDINMSELVHNCVNDFKTRFPQRNIKPEITSELFVNGDSLLLQIAVNNLLDNAIKYSPRETSIIVKAMKSNQVIKIEVIDEGNGIQLQEQGKIFEKFYRLGNEATRRAKGTGLGLYLTKKIVTSHGGKIAVSENNPSGSIFTIELKEAIAHG